MTAHLSVCLYCVCVRVCVCVYVLLHMYICVTMCVRLWARLSTCNVLFPGYPLSKDSGRSLSTSKTDLDSNLPVSSSPTNVTSSSGDESRRPVAIVSPQLPSPQSGGGTSSLSTSVESTAKTTVLDDVCLEDVDSASYGLAAIAEADEEDGMWLSTGVCGCL